MYLSKKQISLLEALYNKKSISYDDLSAYGTVAHSRLIKSLVREGLIRNVERPDKDTPRPFKKSYQITDKGEAHYENYIASQKRFFWTDFRSWLAIVISVIAIVVSVIVAAKFSQ